jgi:hypothetical protein
MTFPLAETIGAVATLLVAYFGYRQWKRSARSGSFLPDREAAYKAVWKALEDLHLYVRSGEFERTRFDQLVTEANTQLINHGLHVTAGDRQLAAAYMAALEKLARLLAAMQSDSLFRHQVATTAESPAVPAEYQPTWRAFEEARAAVAARFRTVLGAGQV